MHRGTVRKRNTVLSAVVLINLLPMYFYETEIKEMSYFYTDAYIVIFSKYFSRF